MTLYQELQKVEINMWFCSPIQNCNSSSCQFDSNILLASLANYLQCQSHAQALHSYSSANIWIYLHIFTYYTSHTDPTWPEPVSAWESHLGSRFFLTSVTNVSISAAVICFSSSFRLLWSSAVIVSSASTSYPICFCIKRNCLAMYSCKEKERKGGYCNRKATVRGVGG